MDTEDPQGERQRLEALYAGMSDGELQQLEEDKSSLTEAAQSALTEELQRRRLGGTTVEPASNPEPDANLQLVVVKRFRDMPEALLARGALDSAGIECFLVDDNMVRLDWFISNFLGGIKLAVEAEDAEAAEAILEQPIPPDFEVEGVGKYEQPRCPHCGSLDIRHEAHVDKRFALPALALGSVPLPIRRNAWKCSSCGAEWRDRGDSTPTVS